VSKVDFHSPDRMRSIGRWFNSLVFVLGLCVIMCALLTSGCQANPTVRWDTNNPSASRFVVLAAFNNQAVLDKNTGLVWEQHPTGTGTFDPNSFPSAGQVCLNRNVGGTLGWRLPTASELVSLQDPSLPAPFVPTSVFTGILNTDQFSGYWSSTITQGGIGHFFVTFSVAASAQFRNNTSVASIWCVRGQTQNSPE